MSADSQILKKCQIVEELSANDAFLSFRVTCPEKGPGRLLLAQPHARLSVKNEAAFFERAARLRQLQVKGISTILDAGTYQDRLACLLPLDKGTSLQDLLNQPLTTGDVLALLRAITGCLVTVHSHGLCHGTLNPRSILVLDDSQPLLLDFGLSQLFQLGFNSGVDPRFCSPEQIRGENAGTAADIYSLGCIFYLMLTGRPPFSGKNNFSIATMHLEGQFPELPVPFSGCRELLSGMTRLTPSQRLTVTEVVDRLDQLLKDGALLKVPCGIGDMPSEAVTHAPVDFDQGSELPSIASKVEALLRQPSRSVVEPEADAVEAAPIITEQHPPTGNSEPRRYLVPLLLGIIMGVALVTGYSYLRDYVSPADQSSIAEEFPATALDDSLMDWHELDLASARGKLAGLLKEYPNDPRAYNNLAAFDAAGGYLEDARKLLEQGLATNNEYLTMHQNLRVLYAKMGRDSYDDALPADLSAQALPLQVFSSQGVLLLQIDEDAPAKEPVTETALVEPPGTEKIAAQVTEPAADQPPEPVDALATEATPAEDTGVKLDKVRTFLANWAESWSTHDVEGYLSYYADDFQPAAGLTRSVWEARKRKRVAVPGEIEILFDDFKVVEEDGNSLTLEVMQSYRSPRYSDVTRKQFQLAKPFSKMKILRENALEIIH